MQRKCKITVRRYPNNRSAVAELPANATRLAAALARHLGYCVGFEVSTHEAGLAMDPNPFFQPEEPERRLAGIAQTLRDLPMYAERPFVFLDPQDQDAESLDQEAPSNG